MGIIASGTPTVKGNSVSSPTGTTIAVDALGRTQPYSSGNTFSGGPSLFQLTGEVTTSGALPSLNAPWEVGYFDAADGGSLGACLDIPANVTLTVNPGAIIKGFDGGDGFAASAFPACPGPTSSGAISVQGTLNAVGTAKEPITFTSIDDNSVGGETGTGKPKADDWSGIDAVPSAQGNPTIELVHAKVAYAATGLDATTNNDVTVESDTLTHNSTALDVHATLGTNAAIHHNWFDETEVALAGSSDWNPTEITVGLFGSPCRDVPEMSATENEYGAERLSEPFLTRSGT